MFMLRQSAARIDWRDRLVGLRGARGVGKTTLLLQKIADSGEERARSLYVSLDSVWLDAKEIYRLAEHFVQHGGARLVLDEVHYVKDWQRIIKNLSDDFKGLKIAYTGSSMLKLKSRQGDLSRRQIGYELPGLSFREFLAFEGVGTFKPLTLSEILSGHEEIARDVRRKIHVLPLFEKYFRGGYYPFYREGGSKYETRILQIVNQTLDSCLDAGRERRVQRKRHHHDRDARGGHRRRVLHVHLEGLHGDGCAHAHHAVRDGEATQGTFSQRGVPLPARRAVRHAREGRRRVREP